VPARAGNGSGYLVPNHQPVTTSKTSGGLVKICAKIETPTTKILIGVQARLTIHRLNIQGFGSRIRTWLYSLKGLEFSEQNLLKDRLYRQSNLLILPQCK
jgi:hypothetical protein